MSDEQQAVAATTPPIGVSSSQIFTIALIILAVYAVSGVVTYFAGTPSDKAAFSQSTINLAMLAAGYYLGSSAGSRNKERQG